MAFENLTERLQNVFKNLRRKGKISESDIQEATKEIRLALLEADVALPVVKDFIKKIRERAIGHEVIDTLNPAQQIIKIVDEELTAILGSDTAEIIKSPKIPTVIMMVGLQGAGKTTFAGKLANKLKKEENARPLMIAADIYRPAAIDQLHVLGEQIGVPVYSERENKNPVDIALHAILEAKKTGRDLVIIDTAGRLAIDEQMMEEIATIKKAIQPNEILFVVDSMTGQDAVNTAKEFNDRLNFSGVVLTKLDGDTRGGAALSIRTVVDKPIKFIGTGEKMDALDVFHPERMADRILGMGDVVSLVERAQEQYDEAEARRIQKKLAKNQFDFNDFLGQIQQIKKMGNLKDLASMIPGVGKALKNIDVDENAFKGIEAIIYSMTPQERTNPSILNGSRRQRIAAGSGTSVQDVNKLIKQFDETRKMMRMITTVKPGSRMMRSPFRR